MTLAGQAETKIRHLTPLLGPRHGLNAVAFIGFTAHSVRGLVDESWPVAGVEEYFSWMKAGLPMACASQLQVI